MKQFTQKDFLYRLNELYTANVQLSAKKNADYANENDPFQNFKVCESLGIPVETALVVRMCDKLMRINNLVSRDAQVKDESILDTCSDLANYAMILRMYIEQKNND
jgi:hypothetical protein